MSENISHSEALKLFKDYYFQKKMVAKRVKHQLFFFNPEKQKVVMYDLKDNAMYKWDRKVYWQEVERQYDFFRNYDFSNLVVEEEKFSELLVKVKQLNPNCTSMSTFVARLDEALVYEGFVYEGIPTIARPRSGWSSASILTKPLHYYDKHVIKILKKGQIVVDERFENLYFDSYSIDGQYYEDNKAIIRNVCLYLLQQNFTEQEIRDVFNNIVKNRYTFEKLIKLVYKFNYKLSALLDFVIKYLKPFENLNYSDSLQLLADYYNMAQQMGRNVKKYPKYLRSMHDIITANYDVFKQEHDEEMFYKNQKFNLEWQNKEFVILSPKESKDVINEGTSLNHCVASYVNKIIEGQCLIVFLRKKGEENKSLITVEVIGDRVVQARGAYNRDLTKEEKAALSKWANEKKLWVEI